MAKAKLLFLSQTLPYPPDSGTAIRSYNVLRLLARRPQLKAPAAEPYEPMLE